jgi:two-component system, NarL family, sensor kinase
MHTERDQLIFAIAAISLTFFILSVIIIFIIYRNFKALEAKNKQILHIVYETQEKERSRISVELHDDIGGKLSGLKLFNESLLLACTTNEQMEIANKNAGLINSIVKNVRSIVRNQGLIHLENNGFKYELDQLTAEYKDVYQINVNVQIESEIEILKRDFQINLYRMLQELLHNSLKHSKCSAIEIKIYSENKNLIVYFSDNGKGFTKNKSAISGIGLTNLETRMKLFNGDLKFVSNPFNETSFTMLYQIDNCIN